MANVSYTQRISLPPSLIVFSETTKYIAVFGIPLNFIGIIVLRNKSRIHRGFAYQRLLSIIGLLINICQVVYFFFSRPVLKNYAPRYLLDSYTSVNFAVNINVPLLTSFNTWMIWTNAVVCYDRYVAINKPWLYQKKHHVKLMSSLLILSFCFSIILLAPNYFLYEVTVKNYTVRFITRADAIGTALIPVTNFLLFIVRFLILTIIIYYTYVTVTAYRKHIKKPNHLFSPDHRAREKTLILLLAVNSVLNFFGQSFVNFNHIILQLSEEIAGSLSGLVVSTTVTFLAAVMSCSNCLLFFCVSREFRSDFIRLFFRRKNKVASTTTNRQIHSQRQNVIKF